MQSVLFDTAIGRCGLAWGEHGIVAASLPDRSDAALRTRLREMAPEAVEVAPDAPSVPQEIRTAIERVTALLDGADDDLGDIALDMDCVAEFNRRVYAVARAVPPGATTTYGAIADELRAERGAARGVGQALGANPFAPIVPCHRVTAAGGRTGGFSAPGGVETKLRMLEIERVHARGVPTLF
ncbi:MAG TPA: methylated-DNA--[protein]-cysteine S-methyltransferase [Conexibacter sp.]|jgi:methylated-DNA-[protein]-cysteine S-methyltransferase